MSKWVPWRKDEYDLLGQLIKDGLTNHEIAEIIERPRGAIAIKAQLTFGGNPNYRIRKTKHKHLRLSALKYFMNHTFEETMERFGFTKSELKSCLTVSYVSHPEWAHIRKDKRNHSSWTAKEYRFLLQCSGLQSRDWIAKQMGRGGELGIKDRLDSLSVSSKSLNGLTISQFRQAFGFDPSFCIHTKAGPKRKAKCKTNSASFYKIVPWIWLDSEIKKGRLQTVEPMKKIIASMALFQKWVHGKDPLKNMQKIVNDQLEFPA